MTSKAAKKAYQQAQRGPRISKAEQRKRDAAEYERIRKEHEKERNAAKAKAAREKKAAKSEAEKDARKKAGLPEPSRFVRASQPTIAKFIRNNSTAKRSWNQMEGLAEEMDDAISDAGVEAKDEAQPLAKRVAMDQESEDEFGEFPSLSQSVLEDIDSSVLAASAPVSPAKKQNVEAASCSPMASPQLPPRKATDDKFSFADEDIANIVTTQLLSEAAEAASKSDAFKPPEISLPPPLLEPPKHIKNEFFRSPVITGQREDQTKGIRREQTWKSLSNSVSRPALRELSMNMLPPRLPLLKPISFATPPTRPDLLRFNNRFSSGPPLATQAYLEDHLDDFFPSPSQQVRELLEDVDDIPSNTQIAREISPEESMSNKPMGGSTLTKKPDELNVLFDDLLCTQDLVLSPQDLEEIATPSRPQPKAAAQAKERVQKPPLARPTSRDRPRFFEEKEEDLLQAALHESKTASRTQLPAKQAPKAAPTSAKGPSTTGKRTSRAPRFFEEKEEDILQAVLHESKTLAAKHVKPKVAPKKGRLALTHEISATTDYGDFNFDEFFGGEEEKQLQAVIEESKKAAGVEAQKVPLKEAPEKQRRTLKRVASVATDYGDDDFSGCSQELLALL